MSYPILAPSNTWYKSTQSRNVFTLINIVDSYSPTGNETETWNADVDDSGSIKCYVTGTILTIAGNGSGKIMANENGRLMFSDESINSGFKYVTAINGVDLIDVSNCTNLDLCFQSCMSVKTLKVDDWDVSNVTSMHSVFLYCIDMTEVDVSKWDISSSDTVYQMFSYCQKLTSLDLSNWCMKENILYCRHMFMSCSALTTIGDTSNWNLSNVRYAQGMFVECSKLSSLNVSNWGFDSNVNFEAMFQNCSSLTGLDVSNWNVSNVENMSFMFWGCSKIGTIDVSKWDTSKLAILDHFAAHANMIRIGMEKWNTSSLVNANAAFHQCGEEELDLSAWDVSNVLYFSQMFENSTKLKRIHGLNKWDTSNALVFDEMFGRCSKLEELDLSSWDTRKARKSVQSSTNGHTGSVFNNMFQSCNNLRKVTVGENFSINGDGTNTTDSYKFILPTPSSDYIEGADGNWYTFNGEKYAPNEVKDRTVETYYASYDMLADLDAIVKNGSLLDTANAIRQLTGSTERYKPSEFKDALDIEITTIPEEAFHFSGNLYYRFAYKTWDWFFKNYVDKITISDITDANRMFYGCKVERLPSSITFAEGGCTISAIFSNCNKITSLPSMDFKQTTPQIGNSLFSYASLLKEIGKLSNLYPTNMSEWFSYCSNLRYLPEFENLNLSYIQTDTTARCHAIFIENFSLREIPEDFLKQIYCVQTNPNYTVFYKGFSSCATLNEIIGLNPQTGTLTTNAFVDTFKSNLRVKDIIFATQEDGTPYSVNWKSQTIDLTYDVGHRITGDTSIITSKNSGITSDKLVTDDATYQALKNDPDWFTSTTSYSRYNHDSAVNTINSLPDTSAYLTANGGTNTIKFKGESGALTDGGAINTLTEAEIAVATAKGWTVTFA